MPTVTSEEQTRLLGPVLKDTSRAFYLTLRVLPGNVRTPVGLAYLLARTADTITDTKTAPATDRLTALLTFRRQVDGSVNKEEVEELVRSAETGIRGAEGELIRAMPKSLSMLDTLSDMDRFRVRQVVTTLTQGMELDLTHFPEAQLTAFENSKQLDEYTYLVAGCVGQFWTEISIAHFPGLKGWNAEAMSEQGIRFGKALQLTNILRDLPKDLRMGRCYLPETVLAESGLSASNLLNAGASAKARPVLVWGINTALEHYRFAAEYLYAIPRTHYRLRLAVAWPLLMGLATLAKLARNKDWLDPTKRSRVSRGWVYRMMVVSGITVTSNGVMGRWIQGLRKEVERTL